MTLVAALRVEGVPVLLGDFLITDNALQLHSFLPTAPHLSKQRPGRGQPRIRGLRKKIHKINERLVVGFTGELEPGIFLLRALMEEFSDGSACIERLQKFLGDLRFHRKDRCTLVGWCWEKRPICFRWCGACPDNFELPGSAIAGSGAAEFNAQMRMRPAVVGHSGLSTAFERATYIASCKAGKILFQELIDAKNLESGYGYGAELILWTGSEFRYVSEISYSFWNMEIDSENKLVVAPSNVCSVYRSHEDYSVVQVVYIQPKADGGDGLQATDTFVQLITPMYDEMKGFDVSSLGRQSMDSKLWFSGILIRNSATSKQAVCSFVSECRDEIESFVCYKDGLLQLNMGQLQRAIPVELLN